MVEACLSSQTHLNMMRYDVWNVASKNISWFIMVQVKPEGGIRSMIYQTLSNNSISHGGVSNWGISTPSHQIHQKTPQASQHIQKLASGNETWQARKSTTNEGFIAQIHWKCSSAMFDWGEMKHPVNSHVRAGLATACGCLIYYIHGRKRNSHDNHNPGIYHRVRSQHHLNL